MSTERRLRQARRAKNEDIETFDVIEFMELRKGDLFALLPSGDIPDDIEDGNQWCLANTNAFMAPQDQGSGPEPWPTIGCTEIAAHDVSHLARHHGLLGRWIENDNGRAFVLVSALPPRKTA